jgi:uncharacterized protein (DUF58 family)
MTRVTPLGISMVTLAAWSVVLGVVAGRAELIVLAVPLLVGLLRATGREPPRECAIRHAVSTERVLEGDRVRVTVNVAATHALPLVELFEPLPFSARLVTGMNHGLFTLAADGHAEWTYEIACTRRGPLRLGTVHARLWDRAGLRARELAHRDPKVVRVWPRPLPVRRLPRPRRTQTSIGNYVAASVGEGLEPGDIRPFVPGDSIRRVNWRASRRWGRLYTTQYQHERNADVVLMLDSLAEAGEAPATTLDLSIRASVSLAAAYLARKDRVGLIEYGGVFHSVRPGGGHRQYVRLVETMLRAAVVFSYVTRDIALVPKGMLPPEALVIAISPLLDRRFERAVLDLAARGFDVVVLSVSPVPLVRPPGPRSASADLAGRVWALERRLRADALRRRRLTVVEWDPTEPLGAALDGVARHRRQRTVR